MLILVTVGGLAGNGAAGAAPGGIWIGTWESNPTALPRASRIGTMTWPEPVIAKGTIRYRVRISQGGAQLRLTISNELRDAPLLLNSASVGLAADGLGVVAGSLHDVTFAGRPSMAIPAGAPVLSDPIDFPLDALADVVVSIQVRDGTAMFACRAGQAAVDQGLMQGGDSTHSELAAGYACLYTARPLVSRIDVRTARVRSVIVALGDSITDGRVLPDSGDRGWPGVLSRRLQSSHVAVVNAGIGGNRLLESQSLYGESALSRLDRDVLMVPGVSHIILLEGTNDIGMSGPGGVFGDTPLADPQVLIGAYSQIIARAHERGIRVVGATLLPFGGSLYDTPAREAIRTAVNQWIRTPGRFDGVVDFDAVLRAPDDARALHPAYDSGDHLHPSPAGYRRMGESIDLALFRGR